MPTPACSTDVDSQLFTIYYHRGDAIVFSSGSMTYNILTQTLQQLTAEGLSPIAITSSGPSGNFTYAASGFDDYLAKFGGGQPWPTGFGGSPGGLIDDNGKLYCTPPPSAAGGGFSCPLGYYYDPETELCVPTPPLPGWPPAPIFPPGGGGGGGGNPPGPPRVTCEIAGNVLMIGPTCPTGYEPDPNDPGCCRPIVPIGPVPIPPPGSGGPDPDGDSITQTLCAQLWAQTAAIVAAINGSGVSGSPGADDSATDALLITALTTLNATLDSFQKFLSNLTNGTNGSNPDPVTCAQLTEQFDRLVKAITDGDASIADALANQPAPAADPNVKRIADAQEGFPSDAADVEAKLDQLLQLAVDTYGFPADFAQILKA
jgi:hypothetical protein